MELNNHKSVCFAIKGLAALIPLKRYMLFIPWSRYMKLLILGTDQSSLNK